MSVRVNDRTEGKLQVLNDAKKLAIYTLKKCKDDKTFSKSSRWIMANRIMNECLDTIELINKANEIPLDEKNYYNRRTKQIEAKGSLRTMLRMLDIAYESGQFNISSHTLEVWSELIDNTEMRLNAWMKSDKDRLNK